VQHLAALALVVRDYDEALDFYMSASLASN